MSDSNWLDVACNITQGNLDNAIDALKAFKKQEFTVRSDWLGLCTFHRIVGCQGNNGRHAALGTPRPKPHAEHCPYYKLNELFKQLGVKDE